ncbi:MAG: hypothetical protein JNL96_08980 [Planctomycetaceae bacterium]|nr:hypothetical protein [Planctomycetaceae bacterium]
MHQNRRSFLRRGLKVLLAAAVVGGAVAKTEKAEAARCRRRRCRSGGCCY